MANTDVTRLVTLSSRAQVGTGDDVLITITQLFMIGLNLLQPDGTLMLDAKAQPDWEIVSSGQRSR